MKDQEVPVSHVLRVIHSNFQAADVTITVNGRVVATNPALFKPKKLTLISGILVRANSQQPCSASGWH